MDLYIDKGAGNTMVDYSNGKQVTYKLKAEVGGSCARTPVRSGGREGGACVLGGWVGWGGWGVFAQAHAKMRSRGPRGVVGQPAWPRLRLQDGVFWGMYTHHHKLRCSNYTDDTEITIFDGYAAKVRCGAEHAHHHPIARMHSPSITT